MIQPLAKRLKEPQNLKSPENKRVVIKIFGCLGFFSCYIQNLLVDSQPSNELIKNLPLSNGPLGMKNCLKKSKPELAKRLHWQYPQWSTPSIFSFNSRVFGNAEKKMPNLHRELRGIVSALQAYKYFIIGSPFLIYLYCDQKPNFYLWGRERSLSH